MTDPLDETRPALNVSTAKACSLELIQRLLDRVPRESLAPAEAQPAPVGAVARTLHPGIIPGTKRYPGTAAVCVRNPVLADQHTTEIVAWLAQRPGWVELERYLDEEHPRYRSPEGYEVSVSALRPNEGFPMVSINTISPDFVPPATHHQATSRY